MMVWRSDTPLETASWPTPRRRCTEPGSDYLPVGYETNMAAIYAACDVLVGRGGASTAHEVAATGTPAVLVPWAESADDHQTLNVTWLSGEGAAIHLPEARIAELDDVLDRLRRDPGERRRLEQAGRRHG